MSMQSPRALRKRLDFRFDEFQHYRQTFAETGVDREQDAAVDHARALWAIALRLTARERAILLDALERPCSKR